MFALLTRHKEFGGMGLPKKYHLAAHLMRLIDCNCHGDFKDWVPLELCLNSFPLLFSPWNLGLRHKQLLQLHPITKTTLYLWREAEKLPEVTSTLSPLTPLFGIPDFPPGSGNRLLCSQQPTNPYLQVSVSIKGHSKTMGH